MRRREEFKIIVSIITILVVSTGLWGAAYFGIFAPGNSKEVVNSNAAAATAGSSNTNSPSQSAQASAASTSNSTSVTTSSSGSVRTFILSELSKYNGLNGQPAYIAIDGVVYDVSNVRAWRNGSHQGYQAGQDLSAAFASSPHSPSMLNSLKIVGKLVN